MTELDTLVKVAVKTLDKNTEVEVSVKCCDGEISVHDLHNKVCTELGLQSGSKAYFSIFEGNERIKKRLKPIETISKDSCDLTIQKWCFDIKTEKSILLRDPVATHLLYLQACHDVTTGKLKPTAEQLHKLEEFLEPGFPLENQYVCLCQTLDNYLAVQFMRCKVQEDFSANTLTITKATEATLNLIKSGLEIHTGNKIYFVSWYCVKSWKRSPDDTSVSFEIMLSSGLSVWLCLESDQVPYMLSVLLEIVKLLQSEDEDAPAFLTSMIRTTDEVITHWDNALFDPSKQVTLKQGHQDLVKL